MSLELTGAQAGVWFAQQLDPASPAFNAADAIEVTGALEPALLEAALQRVVRENEGLRMRFADGPRQVEGDAVPVLERAVTDDPEGWMAAAGAVPVDLARGPLVRSALLRTGEEHWIWWVRVHHIAIDAYGMSMLVRRAAEVYSALAAGEPVPANPLRPLALLVEEDRAYRGSPARAADRAFWTARLAGVEPCVPTGAGATSWRTSLVLGADVAEALRGAARAAGVGRPELVVAVLAAYLGRIEGREEVVLGLPVMGRLGSVGLRVLAMAVNVVPLRLAVAPSRELDAVARAARDELRAVRPHARYRLEELRRDLRLAPGERVTGPLVNVKPFVQHLRLGAATARIRNLAAGPVDDLTITVDEDGPGGGLVVTVDGNPALHDAAGVARHASRLAHALEAAGRPERPTVGALPILPEAERRFVVETVNATDHPVPPGTLTERLAEHAASEAVAVVFEGERLTYAQLHARADRLARVLAARGAGPERVVGLCLPRSAELIVAVLAVLKAGAAWLPLEPGLPLERLKAMHEDARPVCVITDRAGVLPGLVRLDALRGESEGDPVPPAPGDPAYVLFTSGSTGRPKGVVVEHAAIANRLAWMQAEYGLVPGEAVVQKTPIGFDVSVWELLWPLLEGATLVVARRDGHRDPAYLAELFRRERVTTTHFVPSMLAAFLGHPAAAACTGLRRVLCSGEALGEELAARFHAVLPGVELHNLYGPTEAAVDVTAWEHRTGDTGAVPIGRPVWNTRAHVVDGAGAPAGIGVPGELLLAGAQLARGYVGRPELTAERFGEAFGERVYRTGDLARRRADGALEYLGRCDDQVKLRGQRIEPGEVEATLLRHPGVTQAAVVLREDMPGGAGLVAYVVGEAGGLREHAARTLPEAMVPAAIVALDALPVTANGKLDRRALPAPALPDVTLAVPATPREETLCRLFAEVLGRRRVGPADGFFELGGHSLLALELLGRITTELGPGLTVAALFAAPTPAGLAARLAGGDDAGALAPVLSLRPGSAPALFCLPPAGGLGWCYAGLLRHLPPERPVHALQGLGLGEPASLDALAELHLERIRALQPEGPYHLLGWSVGGVLAQAIAARLDPGEVGLVVLLDAYPSEQWRDVPPPSAAVARQALLTMAGVDPVALGAAALTEDGVVAALRRDGSALASLPAAAVREIVDVVRTSSRLMREHEHARHDGEVLFVRAAAPRAEHWLTPEAWRPHVATLTVHELPVTHPELVRPAALAAIGPLVAAALSTGSRLRHVGRSGG